MSKSTAREISTHLLRVGSSYGVLILLVGSVVLNAALVRELRAVRKQTPRQLDAGIEVPPISGKNASGQSTRIGYRGELPTILYYFSPLCGWCERNWENVRYLVEATRGRYRVIGLSAADEYDSALRRRSVTIDVLHGFDADTVNAYRLGGTPQTVVVGPDGRVRRAWTGAYSGPLALDMEAYFGVRFPGLTGPPTDRGVDLPQ